MSARSHNALVIVLLVLCILSGVGHWVHWKLDQAPEVFRGTPTGETLTDEERADRLVEAIDLMRDGGMDPRREDFDLPEGWTPPPGWSPPDNWTPPTWWKD